MAALKRRIAAASAHSLLDIGAGNGDLAVPLSKLIDVYVAIEPKPDYAAKLQRAGITTIQGAFPCEISQTFDVVLASHVIPWEEAESEAFLRAAWKRLNQSASFMMITYDEEKSAWGELLEKSGLPLTTVGQGHLDGYKKLLASFGVLETETITTYVETDGLDEMLLALSFVYGDGKPEDDEQFRENSVVKKTLETRYHFNGHYRFPFTHYLLQARKIS